ncbi:perlucin-like [Saccostrea cucullata]|uniref:perlucin-like n=1 Tax=Saccostrea cuccullata TaxID=36930 RepID=UPI002ED11721
MVFVFVFDFLPQKVGEHPGYTFHSIPATSLDAKKWTLIEVNPDQEYLQHPFKIILENNIRTYVYIDDIMIYNARCNADGVRSPVCPFGSFTRKEGSSISCYTFHPEPLIYVDAIKSCKRVWPDASLLQIETAEEQTFISYHINNSQAMTYAADFGIWIGGNDIDTEHNFVWIGSENPIPFNYTNWHQGQPNNMNGDQDCVMLQYRTNNNDYEWGDVGCAEKHSFICEMTYGISHAPSHQYPNTVIG